MDKVQAEQIITSAFNTLIEKLKTQTDYNPQLIIDDLHHLAKTLSSDTKLPLHLHTADKSFELEYKAIAEKSLESYANTHESVERINQEQQRIIQESHENENVKVDEILNNFSSVHGQVEEQMRRANEIIQTLNKQVVMLENASNLDPLTRTFNRRALENYIDTVCNMEKRPFETRILLIDIDDFKRVNDQYGHLAGDRVLMFLGKLISNSLRDGDKVFRFGGEEFLVILNRGNENTCEKVSERILNGVRTNTLLYKQHQIKITLSMGSAVFQEGDNFESFIERADQALYKAKANGKDQLVAG